MATNREKQLAIQILKERIERVTGKKVILKEAAIRDSAQAKSLFHDAVLDLIQEYVNEGLEYSDAKETLIEISNQIK